MRILKSKRFLTIVATVVVLSLLAVPVALAWPFNDVPPGYWAETAIHRIANLHITSGCGGNNYCPEQNVTRAQMAGFMNNLTKAYTTEPEPYIISLDHQGYTNPDAPALVAKSLDGDGLQGVSYGGTNFANNGVYGETNSEVSGEAGVVGHSISTATGVIGLSDAAWGGYVQGASGQPDLVLGGVVDDDGRLWSDPAQGGSDLLIFSNDEVWVDLDDNNNEGGSFQVRDSANVTMMSVDENWSWYTPWVSGGQLDLRNRDDMYIHLDDLNEGSWGNLVIVGPTDNWAFRVDDTGWTEVYGNLDVYGIKNAAVQTSDGYRRMSAVESPEVWFEDFGTGQLVDGQTVVDLEAVYLQTVNTNEPYHVYLTPLGDCNGLYATNKTTTSFEVRELGGGTASVEFDYRIVAKRLGYEATRLEPVPDLGTDPGEVGHTARPTPADLPGADEPDTSVTPIFITGEEPD